MMIEGIVERKSRSGYKNYKDWSTREEGGVIGDREERERVIIRESSMIKNRKNPSYSLG